MSTAAKAVAKPRHKLRGGSDLRTGYLLLAPWLFGFVFMYLVPAVMSIYYSFTNYNLLSAPDWVGLDNYIQIFTQDQNFRQAMSVTFRYVFIMVPLRLAFALFVATLLNKKHMGMAFYRVDVCAVAAGGVLTLTVHNTGAPVPPERLTAIRAFTVKPQGHGIGLKNIYERLAMLYRDFTFDFDSTAQAGTTVRIVLRQEERREESI